MTWTAKDAGIGGISGGDGGDFSIGGLGGSSGALGQSDVLGKEIDKSNPYLNADKKAKKKKEEDEARANELLEQTKLLNPKLDAADKQYKDDFTDKSGDYLNTAKGLVGNWQTEIDNLTNQSKNQATDATATYKNTILPELMTHMQGAKNNAAGAITLAEVQDPNNKLVTAIRDLYNQMGMDANRQGQQDFGVLSALGAQAAQGQFGASGPMTAGAMGQIYGANQRQASEAYSKAQQRMHDLQQQGITEGWRQNEHWYDKGQEAQKAYGDSITGLSDAEKNYYDQQGKFRDEITGYTDSTLGVQAGLNADVLNIGNMGSAIDKGNAYAGVGREQDLINKQYGIGQGISDNEMEAFMANNAGKAQFISSLAGMFGGALGNKAGAVKG